MFETPALQPMKEKAREGWDSRQSGDRIVSLTKQSNIFFVQQTILQKKTQRRKCEKSKRTAKFFLQETFFVPQWKKNINYDFLRLFFSSIIFDYACCN